MSRDRVPLAPDEARRFLLARRPGWRVVEALSDVAVLDGVVRLPSVAPPPPAPTARCELVGCDEIVVVDRAARRVSFVAGNGQVRARFGPYAPDGETVVAAVAERVLGPTDTHPRLVWPAGTWDPAAVAPGPRPGSCWVVDPTNGMVHHVDRRHGWVERHTGTTPPPPPGCPPDPAAPFATSARLVVGPLDSGLEECDWDRIALCGDVPTGTRVAVRTLASDLEWTTAELALLPDGEWSRVVHCDAIPPGDAWDVLVHAHPGRYLWLELTLLGDGRATPRLDDAEIHYPRATTGRFLPSALSAGPDGGAFLDRYLAITDAVRAGVTRHLDELPYLLDPDTTPADPTRDFLAWLSSWMGVDDAETLPVARRRRLLAAAAGLYRQRGTPEGVRRHAELWLGRPVHLLEHYRLRRWAVLTGARLGDTSRLFGPDVVRRLQLGEYDRIGSFRLVDLPEPQADPFAVYAHRFTLVVRAARPDDVERLADRAAHIVALVAPAHTLADVAVVRPRLRVGVQATIGVDAAVGAGPDPEPLGEGRLGRTAVGEDPHGGRDGLGNRTRIARSTVR